MPARNKKRTEEGPNEPRECTAETDRLMERENQMKVETPQRTNPQHNTRLNEIPKEKIFFQRWQRTAPAQIVQLRELLRHTSVGGTPMRFFDTPWNNISSVGTVGTWQTGVYIVPTSRIRSTHTA